MDPEEYYRSKEERDPRKRKRNSDEMAVYDDRQWSRYLSSKLFNFYYPTHRQ